MAYSDESDAIVKRLKASLAYVDDAHTRRMAAAWARAWDDLAPELQAVLQELADTAGGVTRAQLIRSRRLANALATIERALIDLVDLSATDIIGELDGVIDQAGRITDQLISSQLPPSVSVDGWARVDDAQVAAIVKRTSGRITKQSYPLPGRATTIMKRELVRGMLAGSNPRTVARRVIDRSERIFNGGMNRALVIARTEMLDAQRAAAKLGEQANADVLATWIWTSALGLRTCPSCWAKHGTEYPLDQPGPEDHHCGRCTRTPKTKSWRELGFDIDEPPSLLPNAMDRFGQLTPEQQLDILGPARYAAWQSGKYPMNTWTARHDNDGWRDSWSTSPAPAEFRGARVGDPLGGAGSGGRRPPRTTFGEGFGPEPPDRDGMLAYWLDRQSALPVSFGGDVLEPQEVRFVERFLNAGQQLEWIPKNARGKSTPGFDFRWLNNGGIDVELKSTLANYDTTRRAITKDAKKAANHAARLVKTRYLVDFEDQAVSADLLRELAGYNVDRRLYRLDQLWVMIRGSIREITLRT